MKKNIIGRRLHDLREDNDLTQSALGKILGVSHSQVAKYESGVNEMSTSKILAAAEYFKTTPNYLLGYDQPRNGQLPLNDLTDEQIEILFSNADTMRKQNQKRNPR